MTGKEMPKIVCLCGCGRQFRPKTAWHMFFSAKCKHRYSREMARRGREFSASKAPSEA